MKNTQNNSLETNEIQLPHGGRLCRSFKKNTITVLLVLVLGWVVTIAIVETWPSVGASVANKLRDLIGPREVARLETIVFLVQDTIQHLQYQYTPKQAESPWESYSAHIGGPSQTPISIMVAPHNPQPSRLTPTPSINTETPIAAGISASYRDQITEKVARPTQTPTPYLWQLSPLVPFGSLEGEGVWQPYLYNGEGNVVASRTFLQPDPERPYTIVAVVAFDLNRTRLHFVLGFNEPSLPDGPKGDGLIPEEYREDGVLLAAFNGGYRAANGHFGAMADGILALPPISEMATVGIYRNGDVRIGNWGEEINDTSDLEAWRQNCRLMIRDGEISPRVYNNSITDWGASINNQIVTRRSSLGLDQEARTLYYFAGPSLGMPVLADAMMAAGVYDGMLLDINHFWVHFTAIHSQDGQLVAEPLLPKDMIDHIDRYLGPSPVDFFYITTLEEPRP